MPDSAENTSKQHVGKKPQVIIIEDTEEYVHGSSDQDKRSESYIHEKNESYKKKLKADAFLRVFSFFAGLLCLWLTICNLAFTLLSFLAALILLFRNQKLNLVCSHFWVLFKTFFVCSMGFIIAIFSPPLGIGLILLYVSLKEGGSPAVMSALLRRATERL